MNVRVSMLMCLTMTVMACGSQPEPSAPWAAVRDEIVERYLQAHPNFAVVQGRHEYDGQLPDWSAAGIAAEIKRLHAAKNRLTAVPDSAVEGPARLERDILIQRMDRDLFWLETAEAPFVNPAFYFDWIVDNLDPSPYLTRTYAPLDVRMRAYTKYAQSVQTAAKQIRANLRTPLSLPLLERGISGFKGFADFFKADVPAIFASIQDPAAQAAFTEANAGAAAAMAGLAAWLESQRATATASFALGPQKFAKMLNDTERVTTPLAELEAAGRADLRRNQAALKSTLACVATGAAALRPCDLAATLRDHGHGPWGAPGGGIDVCSPLPTGIDAELHGFTVCFHVDEPGFVVETTTSSMVAELPVDDAAPARAWFALGTPCSSIFVPAFPPHALAQPLADAATWHRFAALRDRVEADGDELVGVRDVLGPLEADLWARAEADATDPAAHRPCVDEAWMAVDAALARLGV